jgi:hypothetical protein
VQELGDKLLVLAGLAGGEERFPVNLGLEGSVDRVWTCDCVNL